LPTRDGVIFTPGFWRTTPDSDALSVATSLGEAAELARQRADDGLGAAEIEEAARGLLHFLAARLLGFFHHLGRLLPHALLQPGVQRGKFGGAQLVEAGGLELAVAHRIAQRLDRLLLGEGARGCDRQDDG